MTDKKRCDSFYRGKDILIPGGAGFIGSALARRLIAAGGRVTIVDSFHESCGANSFNIEGLKDRAILIKKPIEDFLAGEKSLRYNIIFNCVGLTNHHIGYKEPKLDYAINCASGIALLLHLAEKDFRGRMISLGTRNQYGRSDSQAVDESHPMYPLDVQAIHKVALECFHSVFSSRYGLRLAFVRLTNVYGPGQKMAGDGIGVIGELIRRSIEGSELLIYGSLDRIKDILFVDDVVEAMMMLGVADESGCSVYNVGGQPYPMRAIIGAIARYRSVKTSVVPFPESVKKLDTGDIALSIKKFSDATGWAPRVSLEKGIGKTLAFYEKHKDRYW